MASSVHPAASSTSHQPSLTPQARRTFQSAFQRFESTVKKLSAEDAYTFKTTDLQGVRDAAKEIERQLAARQCLRNMKRIQPLLDGLERYSKVVEVLCNGTPYLPWIWAPVKLMLQLASEFTAAFEKLISAYSQISENLPRFDRLSNAFRGNPEFQQVIAVVYADILEFHRRAYKFFRKPSWKCFFLSSWGRFDSRFKCILESLERHSDLVDREANALAITEAREWRERATQEAKRRKLEQSAAQLRHVLSWLGDGMTNQDTQDAQDEQDNRLDQLLGSCYPNTAEWVLTRPAVKSWLRTHGNKSILWLKGKPGSGKSVLCSQLIQFLRQDGQSNVLFYFCSYVSASSNQSTRILKSFAIQILRRHQNLSSYVYDEFILKGQTPSLQTLKQLLPNLLSSVQGPRMVVDGLDECQDLEQKTVLRDLLAFSSNLVYGTCPILVVSRDVRHIDAILSKKPSLSLNDEEKAVSAAIGSFAQQRLSEMQSRFQELDIDKPAMEEVERQIVLKSEGMFLWVRLVLDSLEDDVFNANELRAAVDALPIGLTEFYERIISRIKHFSPQNFDKAIRILEWITFARRAPKKFEVQDAIALSAENAVINENTKLPQSVLHLCKPLIEDGPEDTLVFVHFTVHEHLVRQSSGPFLRRERADYNMTLSCVSCLIQGMSLINGRLLEEQRIINVGRGFHGLHLYAVEYWLPHLLSYAEARHGLRNSDAPMLIRKLNDLAAIHKKYQDQILGARSDSLNNSPHVSDDARLFLLEGIPGVFEMARQMVEFRRRRQLRSVDSTVDPESQPMKDPTPFSSTIHSYQRRVQLLLGSAAFSGLTTAQLALFKATYSTTAFTCRVPGCVQSTTGFANDELRLHHEQSHTPRLTCNRSDCNYSLAFKSLKALQRHISENHEDARPTIPSSIRRTATTQSSFDKGVIEQTRSNAHESRVRSDSLEGESIGANHPDLRAEVKRLQSENEEKDARLRQLEAAVMALQQSRR